MVVTGNGPPKTLTLAEVESRSYNEKIKNISKNSCKF